MLSRKRKRAGRRMPAGRREHVITLLAGIMKGGEPTVFVLESACRHGLRATLCLEGWAWADADHAAADVVAAALARLGAKRPDWNEGQPEVTKVLARTFCANPRCRTELDYVRNSWHKLYCSKLCKRMVCSQRHRDAHPGEESAENRKKRAVLRAAAPLKPCANCGKPFPAVKYAATRPEPMYCGRSCIASAYNRRRWHPWAGKPPRAMPRPLQ